MPYIRQSDRGVLDDDGIPDTSGALNYCITKLVNEFLVRNGVCYDNLNTVIGVLECAKLELYRRVAAPCEDLKREQNGDVYDV